MGKHFVFFQKIPKWDSSTNIINAECFKKKNQKMKRFAEQKRHGTVWFTCIASKVSELLLKKEPRWDTSCSSHSHGFGEVCPLAGKVCAVNCEEEKDRYSLPTPQPSLSLSLFNHYCCSAVIPITPFPLPVPDGQASGGCAHVKWLQRPWLLLWQ